LSYGSRATSEGVYEERVERRSEKIIWNMSGIIEIYHDESCEDSFESM